MSVVVTFVQAASEVTTYHWQTLLTFALGIGGVLGGLISISAKIGATNEKLDNVCDRLEQFDQRLTYLERRRGR